MISNPSLPTGHAQAKALLTDDYGKDLATVEALIRKHEELERDVSAIDTKLEVQNMKNSNDMLVLANCVYTTVLYIYLHT